MARTRFSVVSLALAFLPEADVNTAVVPEARCPRISCLSATKSSGDPVSRATLTVVVAAPAVKLAAIVPVAPVLGCTTAVPTGSATVGVNPGLGKVKTMTTLAFPWVAMFVAAVGVACAPSGWEVSAALLVCLFASAAAEATLLTSSRRVTRIVTSPPKSAWRILSPTFQSYPPSSTVMPVTELSVLSTRTVASPMLTLSPTA